MGAAALAGVSAGVSLLASGAQTGFAIRESRETERRTIRLTEEQIDAERNLMQRRLFAKQMELVGRTGEVRAMFGGSGIEGTTVTQNLATIADEIGAEKAADRFQTQNKIRVLRERMETVRRVEKRRRVQAGVSLGFAAIQSSVGVVEAGTAGSAQASAQERLAALESASNS